MLAAALLIQLVPLFTTSWLPFVDVPPHVGEVAILADYHDPGLQMDRYYDLGGWLHPYTPHRVMVAGLARLTGPMTAYRIFTALYFLIVPLALVLSLRRRGFPPWPAGLGLLALYSFPLHFGFVAYCVATAVLLLGLLALEAWLEAPTPRNRWATLAMPTLLFLLHPQAFLYWIALAPLFVVWRRISGEGTLAALGPLGASLVPGLLLFLGYAKLTGKGEVLASGGVEWVHPLLRLEQLPMHLGDRPGGGRALDRRRPDPARRVRAAGAEPLAAPLSGRGGRAAGGCDAAAGVVRPGLHRLSPAVDGAALAAPRGGRFLALAGSTLRGGVLRAAAAVERSHRLADGGLRAGVRGLRHHGPPDPHRLPGALQHR
jgi:hypothetical protein